MKALLLIGIFLFNATIGTAQLVETKRVQAGEDVSKFISENGMYRFPKFAVGSYTLTNGGASPATLNYNLLLGEMQYVGPRKDTLSISNPQAFDFFKVNDIVYYFRDGYREVIKNYDDYKLAVGTEIVLTSEKTTAYGSPAGATKTTSLSSFQGMGENYNGGRSELKPIENSVITKKTTYYLLDKGKYCEVANKKNIAKIFGSKVALNDYLKANPVNYNKLEDLTKLLDFCMQPK